MTLRARNVLGTFEKRSPAPSWPDSSTVRALSVPVSQRSGFGVRSGLNFSGLPHYYISSVKRLRGSHASRFVSTRSLNTRLSCINIVYFIAKAIINR